MNFFASWCPPCRDEHPALVALAAEGVPIYGVNKSDRTGDALAFRVIAIARERAKREATNGR